MRYRPRLISETRATVAKRRSSSSIIAAEGADVVERALLETEQIVPLDQIILGPVARAVDDHGLVETGRQARR